MVKITTFVLFLNQNKRILRTQSSESAAVAAPTDDCSSGATHTGGVHVRLN